MAARLGLTSKSGNPEVAEATNTEVLDFGNRALQHEHPCASSGLPRCGAMGNVNVSCFVPPQVRVHGWQPFDNRESRSLSSLIVLALFYNRTDIPKLYCRTCIVWMAVLAQTGPGVVSSSHRQTGWGRGLVRTCRAGETAPRILRVRDEEKYGLELAVTAERRVRTGDRTERRSACDEVPSLGLFQPACWCRTLSGPHIPASRGPWWRRLVDSFASGRIDTTGCGASLLTAHAPVVRPLHPARGTPP
jgi:hypothetical protein